MESSQTVQDYDLMFITDATGSMGRFLTDLRIALPQIFDLVQLTNLVKRFSVLAFRDYCDKNIIDWSGWSNVQSTESLSAFVEKLTAYGGGDTPEAVKTALLEARKKVERPTICILYVDAPPHHKYRGEGAGENYDKEMKELGEENFDWLHICELLRDDNMYMYPVFPNLENSVYPFYTSLAKITTGQCIKINNSSVVRASIGIVLNLAGAEFEYDKQCLNVEMDGDFNYKKILGTESGRYCLPPKTSPVKIDTIRDIKLKIGDPVKRFQTSEEYRILVLNVFERLLTPNRVVALSYNTIFGKLWREICKQRKDPLRDTLVERLGTSISTISSTDSKVLQTFLNESYDQSAEIENILLPYGNEGPFYVIDHEDHLTRKVLFEIGLSCAPAVVQSVLKLLTGLRVAIQIPSKESNLTYIPVQLSPKLKFKLLPHLMCPGIMFSLRLSAIMATIAKISGSILRDDATKFLDDIRGKWIDLTLPECNSIDFARLMMQVSEDALTEEEIMHFRALVMVGSLKRARNTQIEVEMAYSSYKSKRPDLKKQCKTCHQWRSVTLLLDTTCALCLEGISKECVEASSEVESWMCECRTCLVHYAVYRIDNLRCRAKCYFCRIGKIAPFVECQMCKNKFLYQQSEPLPNYVCAVCTENDGRVTEKLNTTIGKYIAQNGAEFIGMKVDSTHFFDLRNKISKMSAKERLEAVRNLAEINESDLIGHQFVVGAMTKEVWNVKDLQQQVLSALSTLQLSQCMICFEDFPVDKLSVICGSIKNGCEVLACRKCLNSWYNQLSPGRICQPAHLVCPYCKRVPKVKIVKQYNRGLCTLMNTMDVSAFDPSYIHAWCIKCYVVKEVMPRECGREHQEIIDFVCTECSSNRKKNFKECPKCEVMTEKVGGCNHIECLQCNAHWCWVCNALSNEADIYIHLSKVHGGYFEAEDEENIDYQEF